MIALALVAVIVPLSLALVVNAGDTSRRAAEETRAVLSARTVFEELRRAEVDSSEFIAKSDLKWGVGDSAPNFPGGSTGGGIDDSGENDWLLLLLDKDGEILEVAEDLTYEEAYKGESDEATTLAAVRGYSVNVDGLSAESEDGFPLFQLEVRIETPLRTEAEHRDREIFIRSDSNR